MQNRGIALGAIGAAIYALTAGISMAAADPAAMRVEEFNTALLASVKLGTVKERIVNLTPSMDKSFDIPLMAHFIVGSTWTKLSAAEQTAITNALSKYLAARFAHDFSVSPNVKLDIAPDVQTRGVDKVVRTTITEPKQEPDTLDYRLRQQAGAWKVIDLYFNGVSEMATERSDMAAAYAAGGANGLVKKVNLLTDKLSK